MKDIKGAVFDLDGTLIDSMFVWQEIDEEFLGKRGIKVPDDYIDAITPMGFRETAEYTINRFGFIESPEEIMQEWYDMAYDAYAHRIQAKKGAKELLEQYKQSGVKMAIATASDLSLVVPALKNNGLYDYFENITTTKDVTRGKGFPDIYIHAASKLGVEPEECVVYEDILVGVKSSKNGGFYTVAIYDDRSKDDKNAIMNIADKYINDFTEIGPVLA